MSDSFLVVSFSEEGTIKDLARVKNLLSREVKRAIVLEKGIRASKKLMDRVIFKKFEDYLSEKDQNEIEMNAIELVDNLLRYTKNRRLREALTYDDLPLWKIVESPFYLLFLEIVRLIKVIENAVESEKPDKIVFVEDKESFLFWHPAAKYGRLVSWIVESKISSYGRLVSWIANSRRIPMSCVEPGFFGQIRHHVVKHSLPNLYNLYSRHREFQRRHQESPLKYDVSIQPSETSKNRVLAIVRGPYPALTAIPVMRKLMEDGRNQVLAIIADPLAGAYTQEVLNKERIPYKTFEAYMTRDVRNSVAKASDSLVKKWRQLKIDRGFRDSMYYHGMPLWEALEDRFSFLFSTLLVEVVKYIETFKQIVNVENPDILVTLIEPSVLERCASFVAKTNSVPTLTIPYATIGRSHPPSPPVVDRMAVWGDAMRKRLIERDGAPPDKLVVTGHPGFEYMLQGVKNFRKVEFYRQFGLDTHKKLIVFVSQVAQAMYTEDRRRTHYQAVYDAAKRLPERQFMVKLHPLETEELHWKIMEAMEAGNVIVTKGADLYQTLAACDLVITHSSTAGLEAMLLDKPLVTINLTGEPDPVPYAEWGAAIGVYRADDLLQAIEDALSSKGVRKKLKDNRTKYVYKNLYKLDGRASERVAKLIMQMINDSKKSVRAS